jgi:hypothetical protein
MCDDRFLPNRCLQKFALGSPAARQRGYAEGNRPFHPGNDKGIAAVGLEDHARGVVTILGLDVVT